MDSNYDDKELIDKHVREGQHRAVIGGMWEEIGTLQLSFLVSQGLARSDKLLDIGCGCLRGGVYLVGYLDPGKLFWRRHQRKPAASRLSRRAGARRSGRQAASRPPAPN
jgi:hypothetical protein